MDVIEEGQQLMGQLMQRPNFSENGKKLTQRFIRNDSDEINDKKMDWTRIENLDDLAKELIILHQQSLTLDQHPVEEIPVDAYDQNSTSKVRHAGEGVYIQLNTLGIDPDSKTQPKTITTVETRKFALRCLETSLDPRKKSLVLGTGQPRIGKTRGALAYTLQELLWRGEAVMRVGYKDNTAYLFLPQDDGTYKVWEEEATKWSSSQIVRDENFFVLIDPPEEANYKRAAKCHVIEYCSNNEERHLKNAHKDGTILTMRIPSFQEIVCMRSVLIGEEFAISGMQTYINSNGCIMDEKIVEELFNRCTLIGCIPGLVFKGAEFKKLLVEIKTNAIRECNRANLPDMIAFVKDGARGTDTNTVSAMSRFFLVNPIDDQGSEVSVRLNATTSYYVRKQLTQKLENAAGDAAFEFEDICALLLKGGQWGTRPFPERKIVCGCNWQSTTNLILSCNNSDQILVRASTCYPVLDFATDRYNWFNAKVGETTPAISISAFVTIIQNLDFGTVENNQLVVDNNMPRITLTMIRNNKGTKYKFDVKLADRYKNMDKDQIISVFKDRVDVNFLNTSDWKPNLTDFNARMTLIERILNIYPFML